MSRLSRLIIPILLLSLTIASLHAETITYTFSSKAWAASPANWTGTTDANQFNASASPKGAQVTVAKSGVVVTSPISFTNVTQVQVKYTSTGKAVGSISVQIGSNTAIAAQNVAKSQSEKALTFTPSSAQTGNVKFTVNCTTNSIGINSVIITYSGSGGGGGDPDPDPEPEHCEIAGVANAIYSLKHGMAP